jgi:hypothetical protein
MLNAALLDGAFRRRGLRFLSEVSTHWAGCARTRRRQKKKKPRAKRPHKHMPKNGLALALLMPQSVALLAA